MTNNKQLDYNYIANVLEKTSMSPHNGNLNVGVPVVNLVTPLSDETIVNPNYLDLYEDKSLSQAWKVGQEKQTITIEKTNTATTTATVYVEGSQNISGVAIVLPAEMLAIQNISKYGCSGSITVPNGTKDVSIFPLNAECSLSGNKVYYKIYGTRMGQSLYGVISYKYPQSLYTHTTTYELPMGMDESSISVSCPGASVVKNYNSTTGILSVEYTGSSSQYTLTISYPGLESEVKQIDTLKYGVLQHQVTLKANKSYVLQIIGSCAPSGVTLPKNKISNKTITNSSEYNEWEFDQYLFFKTTNSTQLNYTITAYGISFGYSIYGVLEGSSTIKQLRTIESPVEAKVFLFESDAPWKVDYNGVITDLTNNQLQTLETPSDSGFVGTLSAKELNRIFSQTPEVSINRLGTGIIISLPDSKDGKWKWESLIKQTYSNSSLMNNYKLIVCRNTLVNEDRSYNNTKLKNTMGRLSTIQKTKRSRHDNYSSIAEIQANINYIDISWSNPGSYKEILWPTTKTFQWTFKNQLDNDGNVVKTKKLAEFSLPLASLLGYNRQYCSEQGFSGDFAYKYTSISFAWGDPWSTYYSGFSIPIFIDRSIVTSCRSNETSFSLEFQNVTIEKRVDDDYYNGEAIYIDKK